MLNRLIFHRVRVIIPDGAEVPPAICLYLAAHISLTQPSPRRNTFSLFHTKQQYAKLTQARGAPCTDFRPTGIQQETECWGGNKINSRPPPPSNISHPLWWYNDLFNTAAGMTHAQTYPIPPQTRPTLTSCSLKDRAPRRSALFICSLKATWYRQSVHPSSRTCWCFSDSSLMGDLMQLQVSWYVCLRAKSIRCLW